MQDFDPNKIDVTKAFQMLNGLNKALGEATGNLNPKGVIDGLTIEKSYPIQVGGKKGILNVTKDKSMTLKIEGITSDEIVAMIKKIHD